MSFTATIYNIMIGAPGDIKDEIGVAKNVLFRWNEINSQSRYISLLPLYWKSSTYPSSGEPPQKSINKQVVDYSDLMVCVFYTRFGSPTDTHQSGTEEEIDEHLKSGRHVMVFLKEVTDTTEKDETQYKKLTDFFERHNNDFYWVKYKDTTEFERIFRESLELFINRNWKNRESDVANKTVEVTSQYINDFFSDFENIIENSINSVLSKYGLFPTRLPQNIEASIIRETKTLWTILNLDWIYNENGIILHEIKESLNNCNDIQEKERYIHSILKHFHKLSSTLYPISENSRLKNNIEEMMAYKSELEKSNVEEAKLQIIACDNIIRRREEEIKNKETISQKLIEIVCLYRDNAEFTKEGTPEYYLHHIIATVNMFANQLDAILLSMNMDLMKIQRDCGIYLTQERNKYSLKNILGSSELVEKYINELPKINKPNNP